MELVDRTGTFRGRVLEKAVGLTKNKFPQLVLKLQAIEYYDETEKTWVEDWEQYDQGITAFLCLFGGNGEATLSATQVQKVFGWPGKSFKELDECTSPDLIQFKVKSDEYDGKPRLNVSWIDVYDAEPGTTVTHLDAEDLKSLDAKFAKGLQAIRQPAKPVSAPGKKVEGGTVETAKAPTPPVKATKKGNGKKTTTPPVVNVKTKSTKIEAWQAAVAANVDESLGVNLDEEKLSELWSTTIGQVAGDVEEEDITPEQWGDIKQKLVDAVCKF